jgi:hypothetical protein
MPHCPPPSPNSKRYAAELTAGTRRDRFGFTTGLVIDGPRAAAQPGASSL